MATLSAINPSQNIQDVQVGDKVRFAQTAQRGWGCWENQKESGLRMGDERKVLRVDQSDNTLEVRTPNHGEVWLPMQCFELVRPSPPYGLTLDQVAERLRSCPDPKTHPQEASKLLGCLIADLLEPLTP